MRLTLALVAFLFFGCATHASSYPDRWWAPVDRATAPAWEVLPQDAGPGEVILSKRNELGILSNFAPTPFTFHRKSYASLEGFWQAMLYPDPAMPNDPRSHEVYPHTRAEVEQMTAFDAKHAGEDAKKVMTKLGITWVSFEGKSFAYKSAAPGDHYQLIIAATHAKLEQNPRVSEILMSTGDLHLKPDHHEEPGAPPEWRYFEIYEDLRDRARADARAKKSGQ